MAIENSENKVTAPDSTDAKDTQNTSGQAASPDEIKKLVADALKAERAAAAKKAAEDATKAEEDKKARESAEAAAKAEKEAKEALQRRLAEIEASNASTADKAREETKALNDEIKKLREAQERFAAESEARVRTAELSAYRTRKVAAAGLKHLGDFVSGNTEAEIDASVLALKAREESIVAAEVDAARSANKGNIPSPRSGAHSGGTDTILGGLTPVQAAALSPAEYARWRAQALSRIQ